MMYAINTINNNDTFLPGIKLGYDIKDTCGSVENAIRAALNYSFVKKHFVDTSICKKKNGRKEVEYKKKMKRGKSLKILCFEILIITPFIFELLQTTLLKDGIK